MKNNTLNKRKKIVHIICFVLTFIFSSSNFCRGSFLNEFQQQESNIEEAQLDNSQDPKVVSVSQDKAGLNGSGQAQQDKGLSPIENAAALATGYIKAGMKKEEIQKVLTTNLGYTDTEAEIAYSKASAELCSAQENSIQTADIIEENGEIETLEVSAKDRVKQGISKNPRSKFTRFKVKHIKERGFYFKKKATVAETNIVKEMLGEGYSIEEVAEGFAQNSYSTNDIIAVFKGAGVKAGDTYTALSKMVISEAEAKVGKVKPKSKFMDRILKRREKDLEARKKNAKKDAVKGLLTEMKIAGYDIKGAIDAAVHDLKEAGLSTSEAFSSIYPLIETKKPFRKFKGGWPGKIKEKLKRIRNTYGEPEYTMAAAMLKAGYEKSEITAAFKKIYSDKDVLMIMSSGETRFLNSQNNQTNINSTNTIDNTNTQQDIINRQTQSTPI